VNKHGTLANLNASQPGNTNAVRYGVHSTTVIGELAVGIEAELLANCEPAPRERVAVHEVARLLAIVRQIDLDLAERGLVDRRGNPRYLLGMRVRVSRQLERWSLQLPAPVEPPADASEGRPIDRATLMEALNRIATGEDPAPASERLKALQLLLQHDDETAENEEEIDRALEKFKQVVERLATRNEESPTL
jgi:hypothetical protein